MLVLVLFVLATSLVQAGKHDLDLNNEMAVMEEKLAEENTLLFEGDIVMSKQQVDSLIKSSIALGFGKRESLTDSGRHWPKGIVPYVIAESVDLDGRAAIQAAIQHYSQNSCIALIPRTNQHDYIRFIKGTGCYSMLGKQGGMQEISIGEGCQYTGTVVHEIMHTLGFFHEQSRLDRDAHVIIYWDNIMDEMQQNFAKYQHEEADSLGEKYDTHSIMHYPEDAFSKNGEPTIKARDGTKIGQREVLSLSDKTHINKIYCSGDVAPAVVCADKFPVCPSWATIYCHDFQYSTWMAKNCCESCKEQGTEPKRKEGEGSEFFK